MKLFRVFVSMLALLFSGPAVAQSVPIFYNPNLNDIAKTVFIPNGGGRIAVVVNPILCSRAPLFCQFAMAHERGHVIFRHLFKPNLPRMIQERDADHYAAANSPPGAVLAAWQMFVSGKSSPNWHTYGNPLQRAVRLCRFAKQSNNWIGPPSAC